MCQNWRKNTCQNIMRASVPAGFMHDKEDESKDGFYDVPDYLPILIGRKISNL